TQLPQRLVITLTLVEEDLAPDHVVARERVPDEFKPAQRVLLALLHREGNVDGSLLWIVRVVVKVRNESGVELDVAARAVHLLEIIESLLNNAVSFDNVAGLQSDVALYIIGGEFGVVLDFDFGRSILPAFVDGYHEFQPLTFVTKDRDPGAYLSDLFDSRFSEVSLQVAVIRVGQHAKPVEIRLQLLL